MSYHVAPTSAGPRTIWGYRFGNLRDAMEEAEALSKERGEPYSVWEMKHLWSSDEVSREEKVA